MICKYLEGLGIRRFNLTADRIMTTRTFSLRMVDGSSSDGSCGDLQKRDKLVAFPDLMDRECCVSEWVGEWVARMVVN